MAKKFSFTLLLIFGSLVLLELAGLVSLRLQKGRWVGHTELAAARLALLPEPEIRDDSRAARRARMLRSRVTDAQLHPYLGFVEHTSSVADPEDWASGTALGFPINGEQTLVQKRAPGKLLVGIFGGSVAEIFFDLVANEFARELERLPMAQEREVVLLSAASGGYKQPQQLMTLNYLLALGAEFDLVINIDGFNEVALPPHELVPFGISPHFPRNWRALVAARDPTLLRATGTLVALREHRQERAQRWADSPLRFSLLAGAWWTAFDRRDERRLAQAARAIQQGDVVVESHQVLGPPLPPGLDVLEAVAGVWGRSSRQMAQLCAASGTRYLHLLQPNQYDPGSKPLSAAERRMAYREGHAYQRGVAEGYPLLRRHGASLRRSGVAFDDASNLFAARPETLYVDDCCHFDREGNLLLADRILQLLAAE